MLDFVRVDDEMCMSARAHMRMCERVFVCGL